MSCIEIQSNSDVMNCFCHRNAAGPTWSAAVLNSKVSAEGGSVGRRVLASRQNEPTNRPIENPQKLTNDNNTFHDEQNCQKQNDTLHVFTDRHDLLWSIKLRYDSLYVELPQQLNEESKEKFVNLLEFADDTLRCKHVIIYFNKTRTDRAALMKTFMFLGFHILSPDNILINEHDKEQSKLYMVYTIDSDG